MEIHEDPTRIRDAVRAAAWRGAGRLLGMQIVLLVLAAVIYPAFAVMKVGPKLSSRSVAGAIQAVRRDTGRWPTAFEEVASRITFDDRTGPHWVSIIKVSEEGDVAQYAIAFDRTLLGFRIDPERGIERIGKPVFGRLPR